MPRMWVVRDMFSLDPEPVTSQEYLPAASDDWFETQSAFLTRFYGRRSNCRRTSRTPCTLLDLHPIRLCRLRLSARCAGVPQNFRPGYTWLPHIDLGVLLAWPHNDLEGVNSHGLLKHVPVRSWAASLNMTTLLWQEKPWKDIKFEPHG